jgi:outer membrane receptor protein involved in Fe transport
MRTAVQAVVLLIGMAAGLIAQENSGNIYGRVTDEHGAGLPGATATLTGTLAPQTTVSDTNGYFRILRVPPGRYKLSVSMPGFSRFDFENVIVTLGRDTQVDVPMTLTKVQETVTVSSATPLVDTRKVETGITFSREELTQIPTSRDIYSLMQQVPGIQLDTVNVGGNASGSVGGPDFTTKGTGNVTYQVDGATVTDNSYGAFQGGQARQNGGSNLYFDFDTFDQVQISTGGSLLDLQTPGTTINIVTKRGTNDLKGSARFLYASDRWQATNTPEEAVKQGFLTNSTRFIREYGAEAGGPILKDRVFFWGAASRQDISLNEAFKDALGNQVQSSVRLEPVTAKINANLSSANAMSFYFQRSDRFETRVGLDESRPPETTSDLDIPTQFYKLEDNHVFSPDLVGSAFLSYQDAKYNRQPIGGTNAEVVYDVDGVYHNGYRNYITKNPQYQGNLSASKFFNTGKVNHELKFGFNYRRQVNDSSSAWPGDQILASEYSALALITRGVRSIYKTEYYAATLGDTLTTGNLTVNAGLRYDYQRGRNLPSSAAANPVFPDLLPAVQFNGNDGYPFQFRNLEPRVSATYALGKDRKTLLRGSYARYADQLGFITYQMNGLPIVSGLYYDWTDANHDHRVQRSEVDLKNGFCCFYNVDPSTAPNPPNALASNFKSPTTDELTFGADHQLFSDFAVSATYTYRHVKDLQYRLPLGADASTWRLGGFAQGTAKAANGFTLPFREPFYFLTLKTPPTGDLFLNRPGATQTYKGIEFSAVKRLSNRWMLRGSFGWNDWTQDIPPEAILNPNNDWGLGGQNTDGGTVVGYSGKNTTWVNARWQFNVTGLYQFPLGINLGANFFGREGYPQSYYVRGCARCADIDGTRYRNLIGNIDSFRLDNVYDLDLRLEKTFQVGGVSLSATAECFNITNNNTVLQRVSRVGDFDSRPGRNTFTQNSAFNQILETQSPRILRLGGRVSF